MLVLAFPCDSFVFQTVCVQVQQTELLITFPCHRQNVILAGEQIIIDPLAVIAVVSGKDQMIQLAGQIAVSDQQMIVIHKCHDIVSDIRIFYIEILFHRVILPVCFILFP